MYRLAGFAICILAGASASAQSDSGLTPRQIFDFGVKAPAAVKPSKPSVGPPAVPKPAAEKPVAQKQVVEKPPVEKPAAPVIAGSMQPDTADVHIQKVANVPLALRYSILQRKGNVFEEVDPDSEFHSGDRIRVRVESNGPAYLYIVMIGSSGQARVLFPDKDINSGNNHVAAGRPFTVPPDNNPPFYFDETAGVEKVSLVLTRTPEPDLEKLIYAAGDPTRTDGQEHRTIMAQNNIDGSVFGGVREKLLSRDLVFEKYDGPAPDGQQEKAMYATTKDKSPNAPLFVDLKLTHK